MPRPGFHTTGPFHAISLRTPTVFFFKRRALAGFLCGGQWRTQDWVLEGLTVLEWAPMSFGPHFNWLSGASLNFMALYSFANYSTISYLLTPYFMLVL